jgi:two-component system phosphate regulon sensor histidine kinase PhoR
MPVAADAARNFILVFHDVSETKRLERMRRDFVANVSHELRTPLTAIGGYAETLLGGALEDPQRARPFLSIIERHTVRLGRLVDDLLTLSDLELGRTELRRTAVQVEDVVETAFEVLRNKAVQGGITLAKAIGEDTPPLDADQDRVEQALVNLVDNAIKYTKAGGTVELSLERDGGDAVVAVSDTGVGMNPEDAERIFEPFVRLDAARTAEAAGAGLGLSIVHSIVAAHAGRLSVQTAPGVGSTFAVRLPLG